MEGLSRGQEEAARLMARERHEQRMSAAGQPAGGREMRTTAQQRPEKKGTGT